MPRAVKCVALHFALAAMLLRAFLPSGWMPSANLTVPVVMCTMAGPVRVLVAIGEPQKKQGHDDGRQHEFCPFAAAVAFAAPSSTATLAPPTSATRLIGHLRLSLSAEQSRLYSSQSPRAPPLAA